MGETNEYRFRGSTSFSYRESTLSGSQGGLNTGRETCIYFRLGTSALGLKISKKLFFNGDKKFKSVRENILFSKGNQMYNYDKKHKSKAINSMRFDLF